MSKKATSLNAAYIAELGSAKAVYCECSSAGAPSETFTNFGILKDFSFADDTAITTKSDAAGDTYPVYGIRNVKATCTFLQRADDDMNFATKDYRDCYVQLVFELNKATMNGKNLYLGIACAKVVAKLDMKLPGGEIPVEFIAQPATAQVTINLTTLTNKMTPASLTGTITVVTGDYWTVLEA